MTTLTHDIQAVAAVPVKPIRYTPDRAAIMAALTALAQQTDPLLGHAGLLFEVLEALQRGGMDVAGLLDCVLAEVGP